MTFDDAAAKRVRSAAAEVIEQHHLPGISIGVVAGDDLVFSEGFGFADIESSEAMRPERRQRIASVTKTMVGLCTMALVDEGRLRLDDRVVDHLPEVAFDGPAETVTLRHLLTHTGGIGEAPTQAQLAQQVNPDPDVRPQPGEFAQLFPDGCEIEAPAGTKWAYANYGYAMLGEIVIRAEQAPLHEIMRRRIFGPLGMADSDILDEPNPKLTTPYHRPPAEGARELLERAGIAVKDEPTVDGWNIRGKFTPDFNKGMLAAGAVQSTVPDMARYASALLRRGAGIVRPETFGAMVAPHRCPDERLASWGLAFSRAPKFGRRTFGHGGAFFGGWNTNFCVVPEDNIAVLQHMNVMLDQPGQVFNRIISAVLDAPASAPAPAAVEARLLGSAPGVYECPPGRLTNFRTATRFGRIHIYAEGDRLMIRSRRGPWKQPAQLCPADASDAAFFLAETSDSGPARVLLTRDASGRIDGLRTDDLVHMVRNDALQPW